MSLPSDTGSPAHRRTGAPVGIVVLNWHGRGATLECLQALGRLTYPSWSLVLVDNGCREFSGEEVATLAPGAAYVHSDTNLGFAGGANLGMQEALRRGAEWIWFLNNDAQPEPDALGELMAVACGEPGADIVGAKILRRADPRRLDSAGLEVDLAGGRVRLIGHGEIDHGQHDLRTDPVAVTACAMLANRAALAILPGFEAAFFAYMEDADLCLCARRAGLRVAFAPRARVLHDRAPADRGRQTPESIYYSTRNHLLLLQRHSPAAPWQRKAQELRVLAWSAASGLTVGRHAPVRALRAVAAGLRDYRAARYGARGPTPTSTG
jgi:GT2 family glycosyltransferase